MSKKYPTITIGDNKLDYVSENTAGDAECGNLLCNNDTLFGQPVVYLSVRGKGVAGGYWVDTDEFCSIECANAQLGTNVALVDGRLKNVKKNKS